MATLNSYFRSLRYFSWTSTNIISATNFVRAVMLNWIQNYRLIQIFYVVFYICHKPADGMHRQCSCQKNVIQIVGCARSVQPMLHSNRKIRKFSQLDTVSNVGSTSNSNWMQSFPQIIERMILRPAMAMTDTGKWNDCENLQNCNDSVWYAAVPYTCILHRSILFSYSNGALYGTHTHSRTSHMAWRWWRWRWRWAWCPGNCLHNGISVNTYTSICYAIHTTHYLCAAASAAVAVPHLPNSICHTFVCIIVCLSACATHSRCGPIKKS